MKKRIIFILCFILVVAIATAAVIWIEGPNFQKGRVEDPDCPYAYTVRKGIGRLIVNVTGTEDGFRWEGDTVDYGAASLSMKEKADGKVTFTLKPVLDGRDSLRILLRDKANYSNVVFTIQVDFHVDGGSISAVSCSHRKLEGVIRGKQSRYTILSQTDGTYRIGIAPLNEAVWQGWCESGNAIIAREETAGYVSEDTGAEEEQLPATEWFTVRPEGTEESVIRFVAPGREETIEIRIGYSEEGYSILSHELKAS